MCRTVCCEPLLVSGGGGGLFSFFIFLFLSFCYIHQHRTTRIAPFVRAQVEGVVVVDCAGKRVFEFSDFMRVYVFLD